MNKTAERITALEYNIAKKELEIASLYLSDAYNYVPIDLYQDLRTVQENLAELAKVLQDFINAIGGKS